jgi:hypothetical protein
MQRFEQRVARDATDEPEIPHRGASSTKNELSTRGAANSGLSADVLIIGIGPPRTFETFLAEPVDDGHRVPQWLAAAEAPWQRSEHGRPCSP